MADEFITRRDLEDVTQKVAIQNSKDIAKPLIDQQKNNDLKELERSIEQRSLFQDIADGIKGLADSLLEGLKGLVPKDKGGLGAIFAFGIGALLRPFKDLINTFAVLGKKIRNSKVGIFFASFIEKFKNLFRNLFDKIKSSKLAVFIGGIFDKLKNTKLFAAVSGFFAKVFGKAGIFTKIGDFGKSGLFKGILKFVGNIGRILGKVFLPLTVILGIFDFVKGFMKGNSEGGIIEGIKQGIQELFDGLIGGILRILSWIPEQIFKLLGLNKLSKAVGEYTETFIKSIKDVFGGLVDLLVGIFTWDTNKMGGALEDIWDGIVDLALAPFILMGEAIEDIFNIDIEELFLPITEAFDNITKWFSDIGQGLKDVFSGDKIKKWLGGIKDSVMGLFGGGDDGADATKIFNEQMRQNKPFLQNIPGGSNMANPTAVASSTNNNDNSATVINNNHFHGTSDNSIAAMRRAFA